MIDITKSLAYKLQQTGDGTVGIFCSTKLDRDIYHLNEGDVKALNEGVCLTQNEVIQYRMDENIIE